jgi:hypothetical protein
MPMMTGVRKGLLVVASYWSTTLAGMPPRSLTARPVALAHPALSPAPLAGWPASAEPRRYISVIRLPQLSESLGALLHSTLRGPGRIYLLGRR